LLSGEAIGAGGARTKATASNVTGMLLAAGRGTLSGTEEGAGLLSREADGVGIALTGVAEFRATGIGSAAGRSLATIPRAVAAMVFWEAGAVGGAQMKSTGSFATGVGSEVGRSFMFTSYVIVSKVAKPSQYFLSITWGLGTRLMLNTR